MLGDIAAGPAYRFTQWLDLVRKRSATYGSSGFPHRLHRIDDMVTRLKLCPISTFFHKIIWLPIGEIVITNLRL